MKSHAGFACTALLLAAALAEPSAAQPPVRPDAAAPASLARTLAAGGTASGERLLALDALRLYYAGRDHAPAWLGGSLSPQMAELLAALRGADRDGLRPADYHIAAIDALLERLRPAAGAETRVAPALPGALVADLDLLLTDAFFLYASHLTSGRVDPVTVEPAWNIPGRARDLALLLAAALGLEHLAATIAGLPPHREDYRRLRDALPALRAVAAAGGWPLVPRGPTLREGDRGPRVAALRNRLVGAGDLPAGSDAADDAFDAPLAAAVRRFQERHGIEVDALVGKRTLAELNTTASQRVGQVVANLERLRWLPGALGPRHLIVNVADYRLVVTEGERQVDAMRVIVGREARRTPFFMGEITSIRINPAWTVPLKLAIEDKLPLILEDPFFLADHGFRVLAPSGDGWREVEQADVDWRRLSKRHFPYLLRQDPGPENALGRIKFQIPNRHDIYLHDTPSRGLFAHAERGFSSGCIRVERALDLAERLLAGDPAWPRERILEVIESGETVDVALPEPMPVYLLTWTAWVDDDGSLQFRDDLYGRDAAILEALARPLGAQ